MQRRKWEQSEIEFLRQNYATMDNEEIAERLGRNIRCIYAKSARLGLRKEVAELPKIGQRFKNLEVVDTSFMQNRRRYCKFKCLLCDTIKVINWDNVKRGRYISCGCYIREKVRERMTTHGQSKGKLYGIWRGMKARCFNEKIESFIYYGKRGIIVRDPWKNDFAAFKKDMENDYVPGLQIDRINTNDDYYKENCRWVDSQTNCNNTRSNLKIMAFGEVKTLANWVRDTRCVVKYGALARRIKIGWNADIAITTPKRKSPNMLKQARNRKSNRVITVFGETKTLIEWSEDPRCAVTYKTLQLRITRCNWPPEKAITTPSRSKK